MNREEKIKHRIQKNREEIDRLLNSELPLNIVYGNIKLLSGMNERLILKLEELYESK